MCRLRFVVSAWLLALLVVAASAARAQESPNWQLIPAPTNDDGTTTATSEGAPPDITQHLYVLRNDDGINEAPLPDTIKEDLLPLTTTQGGWGGGVITLQEEEAGDYTYIVSQEIAQGIEASELAGELTPEIAAVAEPLDDEEISTASKVGPNSFFGGSCATHDESISRVVNLSGSEFNKNFPLQNGFSGNFSITGQLDGSITAQLNFGLKRKNILGFCVPYGVKFKNIHAFGNATSTAGLTISGNAAYKISGGPTKILDRALYSYTYRIGPIPIKIGLNAIVSSGYDRHRDRRRLDDHPIRLLPPPPDRYDLDSQRRLRKLANRQHLYLDHE